MTSPPMTQIKLNKQVARYKERLKYYEALKEILLAVFSRAVKELEISAIVEARVKSIRSFASKAVYKCDKYYDPAAQFTDLCGIRVISQRIDEIELISDYVKKHFEIDQENSGDVLEQLGVGEFGYRSVHFIVSLKEDVFNHIINSLIEKRPEGSPRDSFTKTIARLYSHSPGKQGEKPLSPFAPGFKAEIQVRTLLQHAWAHYAHDRFYKSEFKVPDVLQRKANRLAAALEEIDESFAATINELESYKTYYGAYMTGEQLEEEISKLKTVFQHDSKNLRFAHKIARLALAIEDWEQVVEILAFFVEEWKGSPEYKKLKDVRKKLGSQEPGVKKRAQSELANLQDPIMAGVLLDYGKALWNRKKESQDYVEFIEYAIDLNPKSPDALVALAGTHLAQGEEHAALDFYRQALEIAPCDPRILRGFVYCNIYVEKNISFIPAIRHSLEDAIKECWKRAKVGVYLPRAYFDIGLFELLLNNTHRSLTAYARAVQLIDSEKEINRSLWQIDRLWEQVPESLPEMELVQLFLKAGKVARLLQWAKKAGSERDRKRIALNIAKKELKKLKGAMSQENEKAKQKVIEAEKEYEEAAKKASKAKRKAHNAPKSLEKLVSRVTFEPETNKETACPPSFEEPIVIAAGGTDLKVEGRIEKYKTFINKAFDGFSGTIISAGSSTGIGKIIGDLPSTDNYPITRVAYLPQEDLASRIPHREYVIRYSMIKDITHLDSIRVWVDLLAAGSKPWEIRLLGINGGESSAFEFRMALAMGAKVGVLRDSGRAAGELIVDEDWNESEGLLFLPSDEKTLKIFVQGIQPSEKLKTRQVYLAKKSHNKHRDERRKSYIGKDQSLAGWEDLIPDFKNSCIDQIGHIEEKLNAVGMKIREAKKGEKIKLMAFSNEDIELMAEMEHARWNMERLLAGWKPGAKDIEKKRSPYLVSWSELSDDIKELDRMRVREIPGLLKHIGLTVEKNS